MKLYQEDDVYVASKKRIEFVFNNFDNIYVSFSGGKDSGVMLNLVIDYMKQNHIKKKISIYHLDYEAQYDQTTNYVIETLDSLREYANIYHICMPVKSQCAVSMSHTYWKPWELSKKDLWVRELPKNCLHIENHNFDFWNNNLTDYDFNIEFGKWLHKKEKATNTACLVGIRADESLNRFRVIAKTKNTFQDKKYTTKLYSGLYNIYPIYDYTTQDIWVANSKLNYTYNSLYDMFFQAGVSLHEMRVASPFNDCAIGSLKLYKSINPNMWAKMVNRVNGVNFASIYGNTNAFAWKNIILPKGHSWKSYLNFLLSTLDDDLREHYQKKFNTSIMFWKKRGGALDDEIIQELRDNKIPFTKNGKTSNQSKKEVVTFDNYPDKADIKGFASVPSYKRMCIVIMKNDFTCKYMGFAPTKDENEKRKSALEKYKNL
jgi:predicted phosphoadenosine phosphosulfate sulfurtransferase